MLHIFRKYHHHILYNQKKRKFGKRNSKITINTRLNQIFWEDNIEIDLGITRDLFYDIYNKLEPVLLKSEMC